MFWFDWVAKIFVNDYIDHKITPDSISLIFSYPVRYEENFAYPVKFSKFWCFEEKTSLNLNIKAYLESAIKEKIENYIFLSENIINQNKNTATDELNSTKLSENDNYNLNNIVNENRFSKSLKVNSVLNDSVATFFASKFIDNSKSIGIILGTGTNGSFCINDYYIFNSEWGNFKPKSLKLMKEEELVLSQQKDHCNFLDVICGNGYKSRILSNLLENENHYITHENLDLASILKENIDDKCKRLLLELIERSSKILSALICAVIKKYNSSNINIILNGSGFSQDNQRFNFITILKETLERLELKNMNLNIIYEEGLTFVGAAYYEYCNFFN
ncbi:hexokinase [Vairimorpha apis BRL 01]|uniref:Hexokinase n=1 Tax=Vairimorpha apis BRL 01 TaxID=1037528 RepID=T0L874_9MICR|nr:hexokinase [Vairimorpha apis BRL 01]